MHVHLSWQSKDMFRSAYYWNNLRKTIKHNDHPNSTVTVAMYGICRLGQHDMNHEQKP